LKQPEAKKLEVVDVDVEYIPALTYLHCITNKGEGENKVTQTHDYVMYFLNLLAAHGVFDRFKTIKV
jgi:hypothetical protein